MGLTETFGRSTVAAIGLVALVAFAVPAPAVSLGPQSSLAPDPVVGPELPVSYPAPAAQPGFYPEIAFGDSAHLVVWEGRGTRVDRAGSVVDPSPRPLTRGVQGSLPHVAFDGDNFLVVWQGASGVFGNLVSQNGDLLGTVNIQLSSGPDAREPVVDFDGTNYLVVWASASGIRGVRVRPDGTVVGSGDFPIASGGESLALAFNGAHHLLVWQAFVGERWDIRSTLVTTGGVALHPEGVPISTGPGSRGGPAATSVGTSFFVAWTGTGPDLLPAIYGSRVDATGSVVDPSGILIMTGPGNRYDAAVASDGTNVLVAWFEDGSPRALRGARVAPTGIVLDPAGFPVLTQGTAPAIAFDGDNYLVAGLSHIGSTWTPGAVLGTRLTPRGAALDPDGITISIGANEQTGIDSVFDGTNTFVVWTDDRSAGGGVYGARVGPDGQILDGTGITIAVGDGENQPQQPSVAFDGENYLVAWSMTWSDAIRAARVTRSGVVLDRLDISVDRRDRLLATPQVAYGGGTFLVAWNWYTIGHFSSPGDLRAARVSRDGVVLDPAGFLVATPNGNPAFEIAFDGVDFMVVWPATVHAEHDIYATRVTTSGTVPNRAGIRISSGESVDFDPQIAWNGDTHLVVWTRTTDFVQPDTWDVYGARLDGSGKVLDPAGIPISAGPGQQRSPTVAANGPFLVTWTDRRRGQNDLLATRVDPDGTVAHQDGFVVQTDTSTIPVGRGASVAAASGERNFSVVYQRFVPEQPYGSTRAFLRKVSPK